jgi:hypothetical protein
MGTGKIGDNMIDLEKEARDWMKQNSITPNTERIKTLVSLLIKVENEAYNDGRLMYR